MTTDERTVTLKYDSQCIVELEVDKDQVIFQIAINDNVAENIKTYQVTHYLIQHVRVHSILCINYGEYNVLAGAIVSQHSHGEHKEVHIRNFQSIASIPDIQLTPNKSLMDKHFNIFHNRREIITWDPQFIVTKNTQPEYPCFLAIYLTHPKCVAKKQSRIKFKLKYDIKVTLYDKHPCTINSI